MIGIFDIYKIGIGPSSSHTFGPMVAAKMFADTLVEKSLIDSTDFVKAELYGSLSATGRGHLSDVAIILGLSGFLPQTIEIDSIETIKTKAWESGTLLLEGIKNVGFSVDFLNDSLPLHENGMCIKAYKDETLLCSKEYYSIGGGFVREREDFETGEVKECIKVPHPFTHAKELSSMCEGRSMSEILLENELSFHTKAEIESYVQKLWKTMRETMDRGLRSDGELPKPTAAKRRSKELFEALREKQEGLSAMMLEMEWVNLFAMAISEENANGGRVVTAPTNGACGIVPAVLAYYDKFIKPLDTEALVRFFLVSSAVGALFKINASISGAEVGCQGEVGVACSMAASGMAELMGATPARVLIAAEIAMEHHLGLTCDPVNGQVQIPCIERNGIAAVTAIDAVSMALSRNPQNTQVSLDRVIEAMRQTGRDMDKKYRETSCGGLAVVLK